MINLSELKERLSGVASNLDKLDTLETFFYSNINDRDTIELLKIIYNPFVNFGLTLKEYQKQVSSYNNYNLAEVFTLINCNNTSSKEKIVLEVLRYLENIQPNITKALVQKLTNLEDDRYMSNLLCCGLSRTLVKGVNTGLINKAYRATLKKLNKREEDLIPSFSVALAEDATNKNLTDLIDPSDRWYWSRKVDGQRTIYSSESKCFFSRAGNVINSLNNKIKEIKEMPNLFDNYILDGEVAYLEESTNIESFKLTEMLIRRKDYQLPDILWWSKNGNDLPTLEKTEQNRYKFILKYFVFDCLTSQEFLNKTSSTSLMQRLSRLSRLKPLDTNTSTRCTECTECTEYTECTGFIEILDQSKLNYNDTLCKFDIEDFELPSGWEGYMLRRDTEYKGKRSSDMLKLKQFYDTELICYDVEMTVKRMLTEEGVFEDMKCIGALLCKYNEDTVRVGSGLADCDRLEDRSKYINKQIKVKYTQKIKDKNGVEHLRHPVFICVREEL